MGILKIVIKFCLLRKMGISMRDMQESRQMDNEDPAKIRKETFLCDANLCKNFAFSISQREELNVMIEDQRL